MLADFFTKPLQGSLFVKLCDLIMGTNRATPGCLNSRSVLGKMEQTEQEVMSRQEVMSDHEPGPRVAACTHPDVCTPTDTPADKASAAHTTDKEPITSSHNTKLLYHDILVGSAEVKSSMNGCAQTCRLKKSLPR